MRKTVWMVMVVALGILFPANATAAHKQLSENVEVSTTAPATVLVDYKTVIEPFEQGPIIDFWKTEAECRAGTSYYRPSEESIRRKKRPLAKNEVVRPHPTGGCTYLDVPDREATVKNGFDREGWAWVRIAPYEPWVFDRMTGKEVCMYACFNKNEQFSRFDPPKDGKDGRDGVDGKDGRDGVDGKDGKDGKDGSIYTVKEDGFTFPSLAVSVGMARWPTGFSANFSGISDAESCFVQGITATIGLNLSSGFQPSLTFKAIEDGARTQYRTQTEEVTNISDGVKSYGARLDYMKPFGSWEKVRPFVLGGAGIQVFTGRVLQYRRALNSNIAHPEYVEAFELLGRQPDWDWKIAAGALYKNKVGLSFGIGYPFEKEVTLHVLFGGKK